MSILSASTQGSDEAQMNAVPCRRTMSPGETLLNDFLPYENIRPVLSSRIKLPPLSFAKTMPLTSYVALSLWFFRKSLTSATECRTAVWAETVNGKVRTKAMKGNLNILD